MYVLYSRPSRITGRELRRALECHGGMTDHYSRQRESIRVVRWGNTVPADAPMELNSAEAVAKASDKLTALTTMKEAGVNVPRFSLDPTSFGDEATVLGRRRRGFGGRDISVLGGTYTSEAVYSDFFTEFVPSVREMRLHIFRGELLGAQLKQLDTADEGVAEDTVPIRNHGNGYVFVPYLHSVPNSSRIDAARNAVSSLGLDFGAVDLLCLDGGGECVLEVNTAPGLSERYLDLYVGAISEWASTS